MLDDCASISFADIRRVVGGASLVLVALVAFGVPFGLVAISTGALGQSASPTPAAPTLRLNSPFAAPLWRLDVDAEERTLVSSSPYKAITLWPLAELNPPQIARVPLRDEQRRRAHAVAISPDGEMVAYGVPPVADARGTPIPGSARIYILRNRDGVILKTIESDVSSRPQALKFSPDGAFLGAVLSSGCGLRLWATSNWTLVTTDDEDHGGPSPPSTRCCREGNTDECANLPDTTGILFHNHADGKPLYVVTSGDSGVRRYALEGSTFVRKAHAPPTQIGLERPEGIALSPDGRMIAIGDRRERGAETTDKRPTLRIALLHLETLTPARPPLEIGMDSPALEFAAYFDPVQVPAARLFALHRVAWMRDGENEWIFAGGFFACEAAKTSLLLQPVVSRQDLCIVRWSSKSPNESPRFIPVGTDRVMDIVGLEKRKALVIATQRQIAVFDLRGEPLDDMAGERLLREGPAADFRDGARLFKISQDANAVIFEDYRSNANMPILLRFDARALTLDLGAVEGQGFIPPNQDRNILADSSDPRRREWWRNTEGPPLFLRQPLVDPQLDKDDVYRAVALNIEKRIAVVGSANFLRVISFAEGRPRILCQLPISEEAYRVNVTPDATVIVVGHSDGVLRWYRHSPASDGCRLDLVLSVLVTRTASGAWGWVAWVPTGEFANDPAAIDLLSWQVVDATGQIKSVDFSQLLAWYKQDTVAQAVERARSAPSVAKNAAAPTVSPMLREEISAKSSKRILTIETKRERIDTDQFRYRVTVSDDGRWPKVLSIKTGSGLRVPIIHGQNARPLPETRLEAAGLVEMDLVLPPAARMQLGALDLCFFLDGELQACRAIQWIGPLVQAPPRRLWAILVGFSQHDHPSLNLRYAQNDAIDFARLLVQDYRARVVARTSTTPPDFASINVQILVSPSTKQAADELESLVELPYVKRRPASRQGIVDAFEDIIEKGRIGDLSNDLFMFYFSGHAFAHPFNTDNGKTALATPATDPEIRSNNFVTTTLSSDVLTAMMEQISAQKIIVIDACRAPSGVRYTPFQSGTLTHEFALRALSSYFFFSARDGQYSHEQPDYFFDKGRPSSVRGNGLFTYGFLKALVSREAKPGRDATNLPQLDTEDVMRFIERQVFDLRNPQSVIKLLERKRNQSIVQMPTYVPARLEGRPDAPRHLVLRTLDQ